jgi:ribosomal protein S18 acetylase RimI-like enzyme
MKMFTESSIIVRHASTADVDSLSEIGSKAFSEAYADFNHPDDISDHLRDQYSPAAILRQMELPDRFYLLALFGSDPAGLCKLRTGPALEGMPDSSALEIQQLYIDPRHQRRGIGKALVDAALAEARSLCIAVVWLGVWEKADWAINFYSKYGFVRFGLHTFRLGSTEQTDLLLQISAGAG